jgi:hypothetical protein
MLIAISESLRLSRNSVRYPAVNRDWALFGWISIAD